MIKRVKGINLNFFDLLRVFFFSRQVANVNALVYMVCLFVITTTTTTTITTAQTNFATINFKKFRN